MLRGCLAPTGSRLVGINRGVAGRRCGEIASIDVIAVIAVIDVKQAGTPAHPDSIYFGGEGILKIVPFGWWGDGGYLVGSSFVVPWSIIVERLGISVERLFLRIVYFCGR